MRGLINQTPQTEDLCQKVMHLGNPFRRYENVPYKKTFE
jgi:hypothetical protein